jgi:hypothetical protein
VNPGRLPTRARLYRLFGDFVLIVAGVTVALGADSLWGIRQEHIAEAEYLAQLGSDLEENERRLVSAIKLEEVQGAAARQAFRAVAAGRGVAPDSAQAWLVERRGVYYSDPRLLTGTISALLETGDIGLVRDPGLRQAVVAYLPQITHDQAQFDRWADRGMDHLDALRAAGVGPGLTWASLVEPAVRAIVTSSGEQEILVALDGAVYANQIRLVYLGRMLDATKELAQDLREY